jgi:hypothetical protein
MILLRTTQKLLNTSRIRPVEQIPVPFNNQLLFEWYAHLISSTWKGKFFVIYAHNPSLICVITQGRTIQKTYSEFCRRLYALLILLDFPPTIRDREILNFEKYSVVKTDSRSMLAHLNLMKQQIQARMDNHQTLDEADFLKEEKILLDTPYRTGGSAYFFPNRYWKQRMEQIIASN